MQQAISPIVGLARVPRGIPRADLALAAALLVWALLEGLLLPGPGAPTVRVVLALAFSLPLALRRRFPLAVIAVVALAAVARGALHGPYDEGAMPLPALLLASFSAALYARPRWSAWAALPAPALAWVLSGVEAPPNAGNYVALALMTTAAWGGGRGIRRRAEQLEQARARTPQVAAEAVAAERARIARELHDIVAHSVTVISVQAGAAEELLARAPQRARGHLEAMRGAAREALTELRSLVGVLREDEPQAEPQRGLAALDELLDASRAAGIAVRLEVEGTPAALAPGLDLTAYRIVQESLTNVRPHTGRARARLRIVHGSEQLEIEFVNEPGDAGRALGPGSGRGLAEMGERVRLLGGTLHWGPTDAGGWSVRVHLPLTAPHGAPAGAAPAPAEPPRDALLRLAGVPRHVPRADLAIAGGIFVWALLEALLVAASGPLGVRLLLAVGFSAPLLLRRRRPFEAVALICAVALLSIVLLSDSQEITSPFPALLVATFSAGLYARPPRLAVAGLALPLGAVVAIAVLGKAATPAPVDIAIMGALTSGAWAAGWTIRRRAAQIGREYERAAGAARDAIASERARLARELHDVVAHSLTVTAMQVGAAEELLERDPERAREHLASVRAAAHEALVELRRLVGLLGEDGDEPQYAPQPGLDRLEELVAQTREAGVPITLRREGEEGALAAGLELAAYRIVQESLTNVRRHAGAAATDVLVRRAPDRLELEVVNAPGDPDGGVGAGSGRGLIGMRERVRLYAGTLDTGPTADGGFAVRARLPVEGPAT